MLSDEILTRLDAHCRKLIEVEVLPYVSQDAGEGTIYALGLMSIQREDSDWLAPHELRLGRVVERDALLATYPEAGVRIAWNVAEFDGPNWAFAPHMMDEDLWAAEKALSGDLSREFGSEAIDVYDQHIEAALGEVEWSRWFSLTDDFVAFTWDQNYGSRLRESLKRNATDGALRRWAEQGWLP